MAFELDACALPGHTHIGNLDDQNAVRAVAGGLAGPQLAVAGPERYAGVGGRSRFDFGDLSSRGAIHEEHAARVENGQDPLLRVEGDIDGPAGEKRLLAPGPEELVRGDKED